MIIQFSLRANSQRVILNAPQANMYEVVKNVMAYHRTKNSTRAIYAIGYNAADLQNNNPEAWSSVQSGTSFVHPFDVGQFAPEFAVAFLNYYVMMVHHMIRSHARALFCFDRFDCELEIDGYDALLAVMQQEFEYELRNSSLFRIHRLTVNGHDITQKGRRQRNLSQKPA